VETAGLSAEDPVILNEQEIYGKSLLELTKDKLVKFYHMFSVPAIKFTDALGLYSAAQFGPAGAYYQPIYLFFGACTRYF